MSFDQRVILQPASGWPHARSMALRVMNEIAPTAQQLKELETRFNTHELQVRLSQCAFLTSEGTLSDGSTFRFVSNSGAHQLMIWPAGALSANQLADWFHAIPTSDTYLAGTGTQPSLAWHVPEKPEHWPSSLKPMRTILEHPGNVTWSNPDLRIQGHPIVLSWRGPRERYSPTTGWSDVGGGSIISHEKNPYSFPSGTPFVVALQDTKYVWMNGPQLDAGVTKVIAACFYQVSPGQFVLRVCSDYVSGARQMVCYDLVPSVGPSSATLRDFFEGSTLHVVHTYTATNNTALANSGGGSTTPGKWDYWQRPHFNKSGTRLATLIVQVGANGSDRESHAVSFNPTTWAIDDDVVCGQVLTSSTSDYGTTSPNAWHASSDCYRDYLIACDFEDDAFVYMKLRDRQQLSQTGRDYGSAFATWNTSGSATGYRNCSETRTLTITHSTLGDLKSWQVTGYFKEGLGKDPDTGAVASSNTTTGSVTNGWRPIGATLASIGPSIAIIGDLSKKIFAIGYPQQGVASYTCSGSSPTSRTYTSSESYTRGYMQFDVYYDGTKVVDGGGTSASPSTTSGSSSRFMFFPAPFLPLYNSTTNNTGGVFARTGTDFVSPDSFTAPPSFEGIFASGTGSRAQQYRFSSPPLYQHSAVHSKKLAAYIGAAYFDLTYGSSIACGIEVVLLAPEGSATASTPPTYIAGAHATMAAPVFTGIGKGPFT